MHGIQRCWAVAVVVRKIAGIVLIVIVSFTFSGAFLRVPHHFLLETHSHSFPHIA